MKQVIRLSENDLTKIIKKVLKEQTSEPAIKVRVFNGKDDLRNNAQRACNLDITGPNLTGSGVGFKWTVAGNGACKVNGAYIKESGWGSVACGDSTHRIKIGNTDGYLSPEAHERLTSGCQAYASAGNQEDNNYV